MYNTFKFAFTLAEVLITLAIIGVITAMTLPALINKTNNTEMVVGAKKYQSVLSQAIKKYQLDNGCIGDLSVCNAFSGDGDHTAAWDALKPYFNLTKDCGINTGQGCFPLGVTYKTIHTVTTTVFDNESDPKGSLADGSSMRLYDYSGNCTYDTSRENKDPMYHACGYFTVDVNGYKPPNRIGRDTFRWFVTRQGIIPAGNSDDSTYANTDKSPRCDPGYSGSGSNAVINNGGYGCTAKILTEGAMNY